MDTAVELLLLGCGKLESKILLKTFTLVYHWCLALKFSLKKEAKRTYTTFLKIIYNIFSYIPANPTMAALPPAPS